MNSYKVTLNWFGELHKFKIQASTEDHALNLAIHKLATELEVRYSYVKRHFDGIPSKYTIV